MRMQVRKKIIPCAVLTFVIVLFIGASLYSKKQETVNMSYNLFREHLDEELVSEATLSDSEKIMFRLKDDPKQYQTDNPRSADLKEELLLNNVTVSEGKANTTYSMIQTVVSLLFFAGAFFFVYRLSGKQNMKSAMAISLVDASADGKSQLSFGDVAGNEEAKESVQDIVDFIKNPDKYSLYGAKMPRGIIFYGPPGTGKTLMAKAIAGEAGVAFYAVSGSDFVQMYVGVGASRIRELFKKARESGKAVIFIDEIDALGKKRGASPNGGNDERDQTLNALLTEMSGFNNNEGIVVIAATNRLDTLDEALLRPGRFDRLVEIGLPDVNARKRILAHHSQNKPLSQDISLEKIAKETVYFSGAMLENLLNEAAIFAAKRGLNLIDSHDMEKAYYTIIAGSEKKDRSFIQNQEKKITAYHEAGHALVGKVTTPLNIISKITIIPSTKGAGGFCVNIPPDKMYYTKKELEAQIMINLAGRAAEELIFGHDHITTGASNDIEKATGIIKDYVTTYGMGDKTGLINMNHFKGSGWDGEGVLAECSELMEKLYLQTKDILTVNLHLLHAISEGLLEKETLNEEDLDKLMAS